jgi:hypothetical protein
MSITTRIRSTHRNPGQARSIRLLLRATAVLAVALASGLATGAQADGPIQTQLDQTTTTTVDDLCPFTVRIDGVQVGTLLDFTDASGAGRLIFHGTETDTFTGPSGIELRGLPYSGTIHATVDASGNFAHLVGTGVTVRVPLHNGSTFFAAGRTDFLMHPDDEFIAVPDAGTSRNLAEFCRELA